MNVHEFLRMYDKHYDSEPVSHEQAATNAFFSAAESAYQAAMNEGLLAASDANGDLQSTAGAINPTAPSFVPQPQTTSAHHPPQPRAWRGIQAGSMANSRIQATQHTSGINQVQNGVENASAVFQLGAFTQTRRPTYAHLSTNYLQHQAQYSTISQAPHLSTLGAHPFQVPASHMSGLTQAQNNTLGGERSLEAGVRSRSSTGSFIGRVEKNNQNNSLSVSAGLGDSLVQEDDDSEGATEVEADNETSNKEQVDETFEDLLDDLEDVNEVDDLDELDPITIAEEWMAHCEEVLAPYPLTGNKDDVDEVMKPEKVIETAARICEALAAEFQEPGEGTAEGKKQHYINQQTKARTQLLTIVSDSHGKKKAFAQALRLVGYIRDVHTKGIPVAHLRDKKGERATIYWSERDIKCSERCDKVIASVRSNKQVGLDVMLCNDRNMKDLARSPKQYLARKRSNVGGNEDKKNTMKKGAEAKRAEMQLRESESLPLEDDAEELDAEAGAGPGSNPAVVSNPTLNRRGRRAFTKKMDQTTTSSEPTKRVKRDRARLTEDDGEDEDEAVFASNSKRPKSPVAEEDIPRSRLGRGGGRKRNGRGVTSNFLDSSETTPAVSPLPASQMGWLSPAHGIAWPDNNAAPQNFERGNSRQTPIDLSFDEPTVPSTVQQDEAHTHRTLGAMDFSTGWNGSGLEHAGEGQQIPQDLITRGLLSHTGSWTNNGPHSTALEDFYRQEYFPSQGDFMFTNSSASGMNETVGDPNLLDGEENRDASSGQEYSWTDGLGF